MIIIRIVVSILMLCLIFASCNTGVLDDFEEVEDMEEMTSDCTLDSITLIGKWAIESYSEIRSDDEDVFYQSNSPMASNYYQDGISGDISFEADTYEIDFNLVFLRSLDSIEKVRIIERGSYNAASVCNSERCAGLIQSIYVERGVKIRVDSMSQLCVNGFNSSLRIWTKYGLDSLRLSVRKE